MRLVVLLLVLALASCDWPTRIDVTVAGDRQPVRFSFSVASTGDYDLYLRSPRYESRAALDSLLDSVEGFELVVRSESVDSSFASNAVRASEQSPHGLGGALVRLLSRREFEQGEWVTIEATFPNATASDSLSVVFNRAPK